MRILRHITDLGPVLIKLDARLIEGLASDGASQALVRAMATFAAETRALLIAASRVPVSSTCYGAPTAGSSRSGAVSVDQSLRGLARADRAGPSRQRHPGSEEHF